MAAWIRFNLTRRHVSFHHSPVHGQTGCLIIWLVWTLLSWKWGYSYLSENMTSILPDKYQEVGLLSRPIFNMGEALPDFHIISNNGQVSLSSYPCQYLPSSGFSWISWVAWGKTSPRFCVFLMSRQASIFMELLAWCVPPFKNCLLKSLAHLWLDCFFYVVWILTRMNYAVCKHLLPFCIVLFSYSLCCAEALLGILQSWFIFPPIFFLPVLLWCHSEGQGQCQKTFNPCFLLRL